MGIGLVLGFFDGVHKAHRAVIDSALNCSDAVILVTLKNSPSLYFQKKCEYIFSRKHSIDIIKSMGVKDILELDFEKIAKTSAKDYLEFLIDKFHPSSISTGFNHTFGFNKSGNPNFLTENETKYGYKYICTSPVIEDGEIISSSLIKKLLSEGFIEKANNYLESNFILEGIVQHGAKLGRTIGFPTANLNYPSGIVKIPFGVYKTSVFINNEKELKKYNAIMNWGMKPTVKNTVEPIIEVHIPEYSSDLYNQNLRIEILKKIRDEKKFGSLNELKIQINKDIESCLK